MTVSEGVVLYLSSPPLESEDAREASPRPQLEDSLAREEARLGVQPVGKTLPCSPGGETRRPGRDDGPRLPH